ncbi:MAG: BatA domain-containing protein [Phycisphaerales bacterium]|nr:BatA domain-containing protein [Phycisphaerales bacterium]
MSGAALLAMGFVNPALLGGLALVAVPILIHLLSRRRYRRVDWAATRWLLEAERETRRRVRLEQWLLLAARCVAMALLALLVARPFLQPGALAALLGGGAVAERIVILDDSASLSHRRGATEDFARLRDGVRRLLGWLGRESASARVTVYLASQPQRPLIADQPLSLPVVQEIDRRLEEVRPTTTPARPRDVIAAVADSLAARPSIHRADIFVLSDFQRTDWLPQGSAGRGPFEPLAALAQSGERARDVRAVLIRLDSAPRPNVAVTQVDFERPHRVAGLPSVVRATIANFGPQRVESLDARVEIDGAGLPPVPVPPIEPGAQVAISLEVTFPDAGYRELSLGVRGADGFPIDDARRITTRVQDAVSVLIVNGAPSADPQMDEAHLLRSALAPPGPFSSGNRVEVIDPRELDGAALDPYDCVILCNVPPPSDGAVQALERFVRAGGGLIVFLGHEAADVEAFNEALFRRGAGLLPLALEREVVIPPPSSGVGLIRSALHPLTTVFPADAEGLSEYVRFRRFMAVVPAPSESAPQPGDRPRPTESAAAAASVDPGDPPPAAAPADAKQTAVVLAHYSDDAATPAIIERGFGSGRVVLFTSTADLDWNDWARAADGSYVVTMLESVQYAGRRDDHVPSLTPGAPITLTASADRFETRAVLRSPARPVDPDVAVVGRAEDGAVGAPLRFELPAPSRLGTYQFALTGREGGETIRPLAVNLDPAESDLRSVAASELSAALSGIPHELMAIDESFDGGADDSRREMWRTILLVVIALLMGEQWMAWWFGRAEAAGAAKLPPRIGS